MRKYNHSRSATCDDCRIEFIAHNWRTKYCHNCRKNRPNKNETLPIDLTIGEKRTWGKKRPDTISRSALCRRNKKLRTLQTL